MRLILVNEGDRVEYRPARKAYLPFLSGALRTPYDSEGEGGQRREIETKKRRRARTTRHFLGALRTPYDEHRPCRRMPRVTGFPV